jgi:hypothetical protein
MKSILIKNSISNTYQSFELYKRGGPRETSSKEGKNKNILFILKKQRKWYLFYLFISIPQFFTLIPIIEYFPCLRRGIDPLSPPPPAPDAHVANLIRLI